MIVDTQVYMSIQPQLNNYSKLKTAEKNQLSRVYTRRGGKTRNYTDFEFDECEILSHVLLVDFIVSDSRLRVIYCRLAKSVAAMRRRRSATKPAELSSGLS